MTDCVECGLLRPTNQNRLSEVFQWAASEPCGQRARQTVNNFAAAKSSPPDSDGAACRSSRSVSLGFPAPAGQVCERPVPPTTLSLPTGPSGGAWPSTTTPASAHDSTTFLHCRRQVKPAGNTEPQPAQNERQIHAPNTLRPDPRLGPLGHKSRRVPARPAPTAEQCSALRP
jgi:hypothetical protein